MDPRTKSLTLIILVLLTMTNWSAGILVFLYSLLFFFIYFSRVQITVYFKQLKIFFLIFGLTFFLHAFFTQGSTFVRIPLVGLEVTYEGLKLGAFFSARLFLIVAFSIVMMVTTSPAEMVSGIEKTLRPLKKTGIKTDRVALLLGITIRFIPILFEEAERIRTAQVSRGADFKGSIYNRIKGISSLVIPLFISVFRRADTLALALESRGYPGNTERTYYYDSDLGKHDFLAITLIMLTATIIYLI
ncbi:MAG: energy-coupling factor transporter transmembrane protein EcfT [bacterium]|nr:energy-coupling factor transporter transmembrane protein EcfT [bacterium]